MKYLAHSVTGETMIAVLNGDSVTDLAPIDDFYGDLDRYLATDIGQLDGPSTPLAEIQRVPPVPRDARIACVGLNYAAHIEETGSDRPDNPVIFARWYSSLSNHEDEIPLPRDGQGLDWECEMAVIIGSHLSGVTADEAMDAICGYTAFNDLSARRSQKTTSQWGIGKNAEKSGPIGPHVVTADEFGSPYGRAIATRVNGKTMQSSNTDLMIFRIAETLEHITAVVPLKPGDVLATGTPSGVGFGMDPPQLLGPGDVVEVEVEGIGVLRNHLIGR